MQQQHTGREGHSPPPERPPLAEGERCADHEEDGDDQVAVERLVERVLLLAVALADGGVVEQPGNEDRQHVVGLEDTGDAEDRHREQQREDELRGDSTSSCSSTCRTALPANQPRAAPTSAPTTTW